MKPSEEWQEVEPSATALHAVFRYGGDYAYAVDYKGVQWQIVLVWTEEDKWTWSVTRDDELVAHITTSNDVSKELALTMLEIQIGILHER